MTRRPAQRRRSLVAALLAAGFVASAGTPASLTDDDITERMTIDVPLQRGRVSLGEIADELALLLSTHVPAGSFQRLRDLNWSIKPESWIGRRQLDAIEAITRDQILFQPGTDVLQIMVASNNTDELVDALNGSTAKILDAIPLVPSGKPAHYGTTFVTDTDTCTQLAELRRVPERIVLLIHGLDDPGWIFDDLMPILQDRGHVVARFEYPNDGPIADSADLLMQSLVQLRAAGVRHIDVVAHSMGGLVTRDVLTRPAHFDGDGAGGARLPSIDRFIMVGTPNSGSVCARLRIFGEFQEHITRSLRGDGAPGRSDDDGSGEAGKDLLPDSEFLRSLNARPLASHTQHTIIAARMTPAGEGEIDRWARRIGGGLKFEAAPKWWNGFVTRTIDRQVPKFLNQAAGALGDGVVTLNSSRLKGVDDHVVVHANHMSMLYIAGDDHGPPASIGIILDRLQRPLPDGSS